MIRKIRVLFISCFLVIIPFKAINAQEQIDYSIIRDSIDVFFQGLDKTLIPTGLLSDYAIDIVDFSRFDGHSLTDSNYVTFSTLQYLLSSIRSAAPLSAPFADYENNYGLSPEDLKLLIESRNWNDFTKYE